MEAVMENHADTDILLGLGIIEAASGSLDVARAWLEKACNLNTDNPRCYLELAGILRQQQDIEGAIENYQMAISLNPGLTVAHMNLAGLLMSSNLMDDAEYHYSYVIEKEPNNANAYANLSQVQEILNKTEEARSSAARALELAPNHAGAFMTLGKLDRRSRNYSKAVENFSRIISTSTDASVKSLAHIELGHVLDKLGQYDAAYSEFTNGKIIWAGITKDFPFDKSYYRERITRNREIFSGSRNPAAKSAAVTDNVRHEPVFFVGFPRSGTTLVEQILRQHDDIVTTGELPLIDDIVREIPAMQGIDRPYPECLHDLSSDDYAVLRRMYWSKVDTVIEDFSSDSSVLVDKMPLNIVELGLIQGIFPGSRVLVAIRDPRDVCLSCFMQAFKPNPAMINFLNMRDTVDFYADVMSLWIHYSMTLPVSWYQYRYEDLIDDFETTTRGIFSFLGLEYPENASDFHRPGDRKTVITPSYQDVSTPVYTRSKARWRNYEKHLSPYIDKLAPFLEHFGYSS